MKASKFLVFGFVLFTVFTITLTEKIQISDDTNQENIEPIVTIDFLETPSEATGQYIEADPVPDYEITIRSSR